MNTRLIAASLALATLPVLAAAAPSAAGAEPCTPTITSLKPYMDEWGAIYFPMTLTVCERRTVSTVKWRDRDADTGWHKGRGLGWEPGSWNWRAGIAPQDGQMHRWVAYATLKKVNGDGTVLAQSAKVYFKSPAFPAP